MVTLKQGKWNSAQVLGVSWEESLQSLVILLWYKRKTIQRTETRDMKIKFFGVSSSAYNRPFAIPQQITINQTKKIFITALRFYFTINLYWKCHKIQEKYIIKYECLTTI